jgi:asparagine synthase (glutamine-hydrolysing)
VLKRAMRGYLPDDVLKRSKQPYMAPDSESFFRGTNGIEIVDHYISEDQVRKNGIFEPKKVNLLREKCRNGRTIGFKDNMAFVGILTTQIFCDRFLNGFLTAPPSSLQEPKVRYVQ